MATPATTNPNAKFVDAIDSHYQAVKARIQAYNPNRIVAGLLEAQDWPPEKHKLDAFYLLVLGEIQVGGTIGNPVIGHHVQWVWISIGDDLPQTGVRQANRGTRFRTINTMKQELSIALYPNYTEKLTWALDGNGKWTGTELIPVEYVWWSRPEFMDKLSSESGKIYSAASLKLTNMLDQIVS